MTRSKGLFGFATPTQSTEEFSFEVQTNERTYRLAASNKSDYNMWLQGFSVIFELRLLVQEFMNQDKNPPNTVPVTPDRNIEVDSTSKKSFASDSRRARSQERVK